MQLLSESGGLRPNVTSQPHDTLYEMTISRASLEVFFDTLLQPKLFADYGPNGLQVEGSEQIAKVAFAVSATAESIAAAVAFGAQALVVHHGLLWKFHGARPIAGPFARRMIPLIKHDINLFGFHLPLDGHPEIGNAASLAHRIGLSDLAPFGDYQGMPTGVKGVFAEPKRAGELQTQLQFTLDHEVLLASPDTGGPVRSLGIITGGANGEWKLAAAQGLDAYLTGEMSEHDWHESREAGLYMFAGGHHATERFGIQALMERVQAVFELECLFVDSANPA